MEMLNGSDGAYSSTARTDDGGSSDDGSIPSRHTIKFGPVV